MSTRRNTKLKRKYQKDEEDSSLTIKALTYTKIIAKNHTLISNLTTNYLDKIKPVSNNEDINNIFKKFMIDAANNFNVFLDNRELNLKNIDANLTFLKKTLNDLYKNKKDIYESSVELKEIYDKYPELEQIVEVVYQKDKQIDKKKQITIDSIDDDDDDDDDEDL